MTDIKAADLPEGSASADGLTFSDFRLPCGHLVPLFKAASGRMVPIAIPAQRNESAYVDIPPTVWCVELSRPSCGWVPASQAEFDQITAGGYA